MKKKVILSAGGTGGHLFPAQSLAEELFDWDILFVAGGLSSNRYFDREKFRFEEIECATFSFTKPMHLLKGSPKIFKGFRQSQKILQKFSPDLVVGFGSFFTLPILIAALLEKIPFILHEQNAIPGKVNRFFSAFAQKTTITFPMTRQLLKGKAVKESVEVLFPLRSQMLFEKEKTCEYFELKPFKTVLLVFGGSQGAVRLNALFLEAAEKLVNIQIIHLTGNEERALEAKKRYAQLGIDACVRSFEKRMDLAMQIADFAITRAGAATIAELIEYELPALLIPYPFATDNHQEQNGSHFVSQVKGGKMYKEKDLEPSQLAQLISELLLVSSEMKKNITEYKKNRQAQKLATLIEGIVNE